MTTWLIQLNDHPQQETFDVDAAKQGRSTRISAWDENNLAQRRAFATYLLRPAPLFIVPTIAYLIVFATMLDRYMRRGAILLTVVLTMLLFGSCSPRRTVDLLYPNNYVYLNDHVYLPGLDFSKANQYKDKTIAAYDIQSFIQSNGGIVAFVDGHATWLKDELAKPLFQAQGILYPVQTDAALRMRGALSN